jgi:hypothetical protein
MAAVQHGYGGYSRYYENSKHVNGDPGREFHPASSFLVIGETNKNKSSARGMTCFPGIFGVV